MVKLGPSTWTGHEGLPRLLDALGAEGGAVRLVGGFVRDALIGVRGKDVDLATVHQPAESMARIKAAGFKAVPTGLAHGTITAVLPSGPVEVTTLRRDVATDGRHAVVAFTEDWRADAARRDFTVNALSAAPPAGEVHDYFGGLDDLAAGRVRFIGAPRERIAEDHLRILRFFRFQARFGRSGPDPDALAACIARANDLMTLSRERIAAELLALLALPDPAATVALMVANGILAPVLPEIDAAGVARLEQLMRREASAAVPPDPLRRLAALLPRDPAVAIAVATRLKLSNAARSRLGQAADIMNEPSPEAAAYRVGREGAIDQLLLHGAEPPTAAMLAPLDLWARPRLPLGGGELIALGLPAGPIVARTLRRIEDQWIAAGFPDADATRAFARAAVDQALRESA